MISRSTLLIICGTVVLSLLLIACMTRFQLDRNIVFDRWTGRITPHHNFNFTF